MLCFRGARAPVLDVVCMPRDVLFGRSSTSTEAQEGFIRQGQPAIAELGLAQAKVKFKPLPTTLDLQEYVPYTIYPTPYSIYQKVETITTNSKTTVVVAIYPYHGNLD